MAPRLLATSDLHVGHPENRQLVERLRPKPDGDWLVVAGDVGDRVEDIRWAIEVLSARFEQVIWVPGNHDLWTLPNDPVQLRGEARYHYLVEMMRDLGVRTPEDNYPVWTGSEGPVVIVPLFLLYDYTFRPKGARTKEEALAAAYRAGVVCADEELLHPDPHPNRDSWSRKRVAYSRARLDAIDPALPTVLVNHFPLVRKPVDVLHFPEFAQWCGTEATGDWHVRYRSTAVVYGHLHIPLTLRCDAVPHCEVSLGYPQEWKRRPDPPVVPHEILPRAQ